MNTRCLFQTSLLYVLYLFLEGRVKELDEEVLFPVVLGVVEHCQDHILHEPVGTVLRHLKDQLGKVVWMCLQQVEKMLVCLQPIQ